MSTKPPFAALDAARRSPFYAGRSEPLPSCGGPRQWSRIPLTTKDDLRRAYPFGMLAVPRVRLATYHESTGSSGEPTSSYFSARDWDAVAERFLRNGAGLSAEDTILIKTPYSMVTTAHQMHLAAWKRGALIVPADNRSSNMSYPKVVRLLRDLAVTVTWSMPTELLFWAEAARLQGLCPARDFPALTRFIVAGEPLSPRRKQHLERLWGGKRVFQDYGSTETGTLAGECPEGRLHLQQDHFHFELLDARTRESSAHGRGQLVVTTLTREAMPLVRYLIEDEVEIDAPGTDPCPCGSPHAVARVIGRPLSQVAVGGQRLYQSQVEDAIYSIPRECELGAWRARTSRDQLEIEIEVNAGSQSVVCDEVAHEIFRRFGLRAEVTPVAPLSLIGRGQLLKQTSFRKPKFLFAEKDDWNEALNYAQ